MPEGPPWRHPGLRDESAWGLGGKGVRDETRRQMGSQEEERSAQGRRAKRTKGGSGVSPFRVSYGQAAGQEMEMGFRAQTEGQGLIIEEAKIRKL